MADYVLSARLTADGSGFSKTFQNAKKELDNLSSSLKSTGTKINDFGKNLFEIGSGITAGFTIPIVGAIGYAVKSFADLEQAVGGVETLFKDSANTVITNSETAFKRAGISGVSYMEQVTSFSASLLQGLSGDTVAAAKYADMAIVDMSDNANKMGTDVGMLQNAYQGFAKDNFTMLDNLKLGYGGTASEMARLINESGVMGGSFKATAENVKEIPFDKLIQAIHVTQEEMGITGTTALEAEKTVSGSFQSMLSAGNNLAAGLGSPTANIQGLMADLQSTVMTFGGNIQRVLGTIWDNLPLSEWQKWASVVAISAGPILMFLGALTKGIGILVTAIGFIVGQKGLAIAAVVGVAAAFGTAMATNEGFRNNFFKVFEAIRTKVTEIINYIVPIIQNLWTRIQPILSTMTSNISSLFTSIGPKIIPTLQNIGGQIADVFHTVWGIVQAVWPILQSFFNGLIEGFGNATGAGSGFSINLTTLLIGLNPIIKGIIMLFQNFGPQIVSTFQEVSAMLVPVFGTIGQVIGQLATTVIPMVMAAFSSFIPMVVNLGMIIISAIINIIPIVINLFNTLVPIIMMVVQQIAQVIAVVIPLAANFIGALIPAISMLIEGIMSVVTSVAPAFIAIIQMIGSAIQVIIPIISSILQTVIHVMTNIISVITPIIGFIVMIITTIMGIIAPIVAFVAGVMTSIFSVIRPIVTVVTGVFNTAAQVMATVWQGIMTFTGQIFTSIGSTISRLSGVVSNVFNTISGIINRIMNNVSNKITGVFDAIRNAWSGLTAFVGGVFDGISGSVSSLVGQVKGFVNGVIGGINSAIGLINKIPGVSISKIPQLYRGTDDWEGGFARINEGGRGELVNLPGGSQVIPHDVSMRYAREAGRAAVGNNEKPINQNTYNNQFTLNAPHTSNKDMRPEDWRWLLKQFAYYVNQEGGGLT